MLGYITKNQGRRTLILEKQNARLRRVDITVAKMLAFVDVGHIHFVAVTRPHGPASPPLRSRRQMADRHLL